MCCWSRTNVHLVERIYYKWQLVPQDPDDDKFVDCAILADVDYLVTNDLHFKMAKKNPFPAVNIINADDFLRILFAEGLTKRNNGFYQTFFAGIDGYSPTEIYFKNKKYVPHILQRKNRFFLMYANLFSEFSLFLVFLCF